VIDKERYGKIPYYKKAQVARGRSMEWIGINPDIYTFLFDQTSKALVGYFNAMPMTDEAFEKPNTGELLDNQIRSEDVCLFLRTKKSRFI
jgi:hypothetical protein